MDDQPNHDVGERLLAYLALSSSCSTNLPRTNQSNQSNHIPFDPNSQTGADDADGFLALLSSERQPRGISGGPEGGTRGCPAVLACLCEREKSLTDKLNRGTFFPLGKRAKTK